MLTTIICLILIQLPSRFYIVSDFNYLVNLSINIGPKSNHYLALLMTQTIAYSCCRDLNYVTLADEDAYSILDNANSDVVADAPDFEDAVEDL